MNLSKHFTELIHGEKEITTTRIIVLTALFFVIFDNLKFFQNVLVKYPFNFENAGFLISLAIGLTSVIVFLLSIFCLKYTTKAILTGLLMISSCAAFFMDNYNIVIDHHMIQNMVETNWSEATDLLSARPRIA